MTSEPGDFALYIDVSVFAEPLRPYVEELLERLGPEAEVPEDPLTALAQSHAAPGGSSRRRGDGSTAARWRDGGRGSRRGVSPLQSRPVARS